MQLSPQNQFQVYSTFYPFTLVCSISYAGWCRISQCIPRSLQADCRVFQKSSGIIQKNQDRYCQRKIKSYIISPLRFRDFSDRGHQSRGGIKWGTVGAVF